jgi:uncharacterized protein (DUF1697 family)
MTRHVALLRAVNLAGRSMVSMASLRALLEELGFSEVRSLLQSGNLVFDDDRRTPAELEHLLEEATMKKLGVRTDCFVRTSKQWGKLVAANPFPGEAKKDPGHFLVVCLKKAPSAAAVKSLQAAIRGREIVRAEGRQAYAIYPDGVGRSKLTAALIEKKLGSRGTARNWNTVLKLAAMVIPTAKPRPILEA